MASADGRHIMYMDQIMNDCHQTHFRQMDEIHKTRGKMTTNTSGFGLHGRNHDIQILPLESPEYVGAILLGFAAFVIALVL
jgi:hypothetical protein